MSREADRFHDLLCYSCRHGEPPPQLPQTTIADQPPQMAIADLKSEDEDLEDRLMAHIRRLEARIAVLEGKHVASEEYFDKVLELVSQP